MHGKAEYNEQRTYHLAITIALPSCIFFYESEASNGANASPQLKPSAELIDKLHFFNSPNILRTPARYEDIAGETETVRHATIKVLSVITNSIKKCGRLAAEKATFAVTGRLASLERPTRYIIAYLLACRSLEDSPIDVDECFSNLAKAYDFENMEELVNTHAAKLVEGICEVRNAFYAR